MADRRDIAEWFALAADTVRDAAIGIDRGGRVAFANPAAEALSGRAAPDLVTLPYHDLFRFVRSLRHSPDDPVSIALRDGVGTDLAAGTALLDPAGAHQLIVGTCSPVGPGAADGALVLCRRLADDPAFGALQTSQARLKEVQRIGRIGTWEIDLGGGRHHWSDELYRIFEVDRAVMGNSVWAFLDMVHPDDRAGVEAAFNRAIADRGAYDLTHRVLTRTGIKVVHSRGEVTTDAQGRLVRAIGTTQDITELRRAADRSRFEVALTESVADAVIATDPTFRVILWNPAAESIYGIPPAEAIGRPMPDLVPVRYPIGSGEQALHDLRETGRWRGEVLMAHRNGDWRVILSSVNRVSDPDGRFLGYVAVNRDVTELRELEREHADRQNLENLGRLAGGVAHDFNNALQAIIGHAELALAAVGPAGATTADLDAIRRLATSSAELARHLQALAGEQVAQPVVLDLNVAVSAARKAILEAVGDTIDLVWQPNPSLWRVRIDPRQVERLLVQLARNAREAIVGPGRLEITAANRTTRSGAATGAAAEFVTLTVRDDGLGMDEETIRRAFEPLFSTKTRSGATGLGLAIVAGIVRQNAGTIEIESTVGAGTAVAIHLPRWHEPAAPPAPLHASPVETSGRTVVLVEDEEPVRRVTSRGLERGGYRVVSFADPFEALAYVDDPVNPADLLITDVMMPGLTGKQLADRVAALRPGLRCLFVSGYPADVIATQGVVDETINLLQKPFTLAELATMVRAMLAAG